MLELGTLSANAARLLPASLISPEFSALGTKRLQELITIQTELFDDLQKLNRSWSTECYRRRTLPGNSPRSWLARGRVQTATICQEWASRRMELATEDGRRLLADAQKFAETGARLLTAGSKSNGRVGGT